MEPTDAELMFQVQKGSKKAFETLVRRYEIHLMRYLTRMTGTMTEAEDLFQDCWTKVYESRRDYRKGEDPKGWIFTIARNSCFNYIKRREKMKSYDPEVIDEQPDHMSDPTVEQFEKTESVNKALQSLSLAHREAIVLRFYQGLSYSEIAEAMGVPVGTVGYWISEALSVLTEKLKDQIE